jgi:hypothetical protein
MSSKVSFSRKYVFGVEMSGGTAAKIINTSKFINWSWWIGLTPSLALTIFARPTLHFTVMIYILLGNSVYFLTYYLDDGYSKLAFISVRYTLVNRLLVFALAAYGVYVVRVYYEGTRTKLAALISNMSSFADTLTITMDYDSPRAKEFLMSLHGAVTLIAEYAFACALANTKLKLSQEEMTDLFEKRGYDHGTLLSVHKKQTITLLWQGILQTLKKEQEQGQDGCLKELDSFRWEGLRHDLCPFLGGAMSVISCVSSSKIPFAYLQLLNWGTKMALTLYTVYLYIYTASEAKELGLK